MRKTRRNRIKKGGQRAPSPAPAPSAVSSIESQLVEQFQMAGTMLVNIINRLGPSIYNYTDDIYAKLSQLHNSYIVISNLIFTRLPYSNYFPNKEAFMYDYTGINLDTTRRNNLINQFNQLGVILNNIRNILSNNRTYKVSSNIIHRHNLLTNNITTIIYRFVYPKSNSSPTPSPAPR